MTKFVTPLLGWVYLVIVLDWYTKKIVDWNLSLEMAINSEFPEEVRGDGLKLISDKGFQSMATSFMKDMATLDIE